RLGDENARRAVGRANGTNMICIIIPCHRVIRADGTLCGYGGGLWRKKWLLEHERRYAGAGKRAVIGGWWSVDLATLLTTAAIKAWRVKRSRNRTVRSRGVI